MGFIYKITSPTNKIYIGKTYCIKKRLSDYKFSRGRNKKSIVMDSIEKYGLDNHFFEVIEECSDSCMNEREIFWIKELKTYAYENKDGMNLTKGGDGQRHNWRNDIERINALKERNKLAIGKKISDEAKYKISCSLKEYFKINKAVVHHKCREASIKISSKPVVCYNLNGKLLGIFQSIKQAANYFGLKRRTANDAYLGIQLHCGGVIFKPKTESYPMTIEVVGNIHIKKNKVSKIPSVIPSFMKAA